MAGPNRNGIAVQKSLVLAAGVAQTWQHNRGVKALAVQGFNAVTGLLEVLVITQTSANVISVTSAVGATVNMFVTFGGSPTLAGPGGVNTLTDNSLHGLPGAIAPSTGFVV